MITDTVIEDARWEALGVEALAERAAGVVLRHLGFDPQQFECAVLACDDARIATLNADFRGKPKPTNVLSWPSAERGAATPGSSPASPAPGELGDIAIAYETCMAEAETGGIPPEAHVTHLLVHAALHLLGYDHENDTDATVMEALETAILAELGLADPYGEASR